MYFTIITYDEHFYRFFWLTYSPSFSKSTEFQYSFSSRFSNIAQRSSDCIEYDHKSYFFPTCLIEYIINSVYIHNVRTGLVGHTMFVDVKSESRSELQMSELWMQKNKNNKKQIMKWYVGQWAWALRSAYMFWTQFINLEIGNAIKLFVFKLKSSHEYSICVEKYFVVENVNLFYLKSPCSESSGPKSINDCRCISRASHRNSMCSWFWSIPIIRQIS